METPQNGSFKLLKFAFAGAAFFYAALVFVLPQVFSDGGNYLYLFSGPEADTLLLVFSVVAFTNLGLQFVLPSKMTQFVPAFMVRLALSESIGVLGLVFFLLTGHQQEAWIFCGVSFLVTLFGDRTRSTL